LEELAAILWVEAILTMQEWVLGESVSTVLQLIIARHEYPGSPVVRAYDRSWIRFPLDTQIFFFVPRL